MAKLGELLELLHSAPRSYERLEAEFRTWCHSERADEAAEASAESSQGSGGFVEIGTQEGTAIDMFSIELDAESLLKLATRLVPAPQVPPAI